MLLAAFASAPGFFSWVALTSFGVIFSTTLPASYRWACWLMEGGVEGTCCGHRSVSLVGQLSTGCSLQGNEVGDAESREIFPFVLCDFLNLPFPWNCPFLVCTDSLQETMSQLCLLHPQGCKALSVSLCWGTEGTFWTGQSSWWGAQGNRSVAKQGRQQHSFPFLRKRKPRLNTQGVFLNCSIDC